MNNQPSFMNSPRNMASTKYRNARNNLLLVIIFSLINIVLCAVGSDTYFLFSATIPYFISILGVTYALEYGLTASIYVGCIIAVIFVVPYLLCWIFSKKHYGWIIGALVYFILDTVFLLVFFLDVSMLMDILFHVWVLVALIIGIVNGKKFKNLPEDTAEPAFTFDEEGNPIVPEDTAPLRVALNEEKIRVHIEADHNGRHIVYRKYGKGLEEEAVGIE